MRLDPNPVSTSSVRFQVSFSESVTGVNIDDFELDERGITGATITNVSGGGNTYIVTATVGAGTGLFVCGYWTMIRSSIHPDSNSVVSALAMVNLLTGRGIP
jgi:hypothetical protein